ncbi:extracellular solute-binding protein [Lysobacter brunescens]|uniref:Putrescine-binding periplasmic protein n=1 Tax=Lysobacter brunescens TaxID=262323 RepID=A0ABW2YET9_9GAMM
MKLRMLALSVVVSMLVACGGGSDKAAPGAKPDAKADGKGGERVVNMYNWSDYIAEDTIPNFTKQTGIKVVYDVMDANETLEAKVMQGNTGYDIVVPSLQFLARQIQADVYQPIDRAKLPNYKNLDPSLMAIIAKNDPDNKFGVPYLYGFTGIGYNVAKVKAALGDVPVDSWDLVFKPELASKLKGCGIMALDTPTELVPIALNYIGEDPNSQDPAVIAKAAPLLKVLNANIRNFHSSEYVNALAAGDACVVVGWSGDVFQARDRAEEAGSAEVGFVIPKEGAPIFFDMMAIPKDAKNVDDAYVFMNHLLEPKVMAGISSYVSYANVVKDSEPLIDEAVRKNPGVYPDAEMMKKVFPLEPLTPAMSRQYADMWSAMKSGK